MQKYDKLRLNIKPASVADRIIDTAKAAEKIDDTVDIAKATDKATNAYKTATVAENAKDTARTVTSAGEKLDVSSFPMKIHSGRYGKHIVGHNNYTLGKSIVELSETEMLDLLKKSAGTGQKINSSSERIDFGKTIGKYVDLETGKAYDTTVATVRYSKDGIHIVPARPNNWKGN